MKGVSLTEFNENLIVKINYLSEELKNKIEEELIEICEGEYGLTSEVELYSFEAIIKELVDYRLDKPLHFKIGMLGELLLNVVIRNFTQFKIISPFFNLEERNIKKGFDIIAVSENEELWFIESKSGESKEENLTNMACDKVDLAAKDLFERLNKKDSNIWRNAVNSVRHYLSCNDEQQAIINLLNEAGKTQKSYDKNVILGATVFCVLDLDIDKDKLSNIYIKINDKNNFTKIRIIAIQKSTYLELEKFLLSLNRRYNE